MVLFNKKKIFTKLFYFGIHTGLFVKENKEINFKKIGLYYNSYVIDFIYLHWFFFRLKILINQIFKKSGNFFFINCCKLNTLDFFKKVNIPNVHFDFNKVSMTGLISTKHTAVRIANLGDKNFHWKVMTNPSFIVLLADDFKQEEKSLVTQSLQKDIPILCFTTAVLPYHGIYTIPNKNSSADFLYFWIYLILNMLKK